MRSPPHEGPAGWRSVGDDPERITLLCSAHHRQRHEGWLTIQGTASTGFRFFLHRGRELVAEAHVRTARDPEACLVDEAAGRTLRMLGRPEAEARATVQRVRAEQPGPLTVEELVSLALRGLPAG